MNIEITNDTNVTLGILEVPTDCSEDMIETLVAIWCNENNVDIFCSFWVYANSNKSEKLPCSPKGSQTVARCRRCNRPLTDPASIIAGYGPVCQRAGP